MDEHNFFGWEGWAAFMMPSIGCRWSLWWTPRGQALQWPFRCRQGLWKIGPSSKHWNPETLAWILTMVQLVFFFGCFVCHSIRRFGQREAGEPTDFHLPSTLDHWMLGEVSFFLVVSCNKLTPLTHTELGKEPV